LVGAMDLGSVARLQQQYSGGSSAPVKDPVLFLENRMHAK
jgi:hypothetical protein